MPTSYVNTNAPLGAGELAKPIDIGRNNLASIIQQEDATPGHLRMLVASAPYNLSGIITGEQADQLLASAASKASSQRPSVTKNVTQSNKLDLRRGDLVIDTERGKRVTIIQANAATTKKGRPVHKVTAGGNAWLQMESKLERV